DPLSSLPPTILIRSIRCSPCPEHGLRLSSVQAGPSSRASGILQRPSGWWMTAVRPDRSATAAAVVAVPLQKSLRPRIGPSVPSRRRLRFAPLEIGAQPLGKARLPVVLHAALLSPVVVWRGQTGSLR